MAKRRGNKSRKTSRKSRLRSRKMRGGNVGAAYSVGPGVLVNGLPDLVIERISNCQAVQPGYALSSGQIAAVNGGLPGMQRGGRYESSNPLQGGSFPGPNVGVTPGAFHIGPERGAGGPADEVSPTQCNQGPPPPVPGNPAIQMPTQSTPGLLPGVMSGGKRKKRKSMRGGAYGPPPGLLSPYSGGTPYEATPAGYSHLRTAGDVVSQTQSGVPFMVHVPSGGQVGVSNSCTSIPGGTGNANLGNTMKGAGYKRKGRSSSKRKHRKSRK